MKGESDVIAIYVLLFFIKCLFDDCSPARLGTPICRIVDDTLGYCLTILMTLKPTPPYFVDGIVALFNKSCIYYSGQKGYSWNNSAGMPQTRLSLINKFASQSGFEILYEIITSSNFKWPGCEIYLSIASALVEVLHSSIH